MVWDAIAGDAEAEEAQAPFDKSYYVLTPAEMMDHNYPLPVEDEHGGGLRCPDGYVATQPAVKPSAADDDARDDGGAAMHFSLLAVRRNSMDGPSSKHGPFTQDKVARCTHGALRTRPPPTTTTLTQPQPSNHPQVDCEMCYTAKGLELTRATFLSESGLVVYDELVLSPFRR